MNWNNPETLEALWQTITRKTHGGGLDLLSASYAKGELFGADLEFFAKQLLRQFSGGGVILAILGLVFLWKRERLWALATAIGFILAGPFFLYLSNMPPNPHALAIVEPHLLVPEFFVLLWIAAGLAGLLSFLGSKPVAFRAVVAVLTVLLSVRMLVLASHLSKRHYFYAHDYAANLLRTAPPRSAIVAREDVQLFSLWTLQKTLSKRPDVAIIGQGLSSSPWYVRALQQDHSEIQFLPLKTDEDWNMFVKANPSLNLLATYDVGLPRGLTFVPWGLASRWSQPPAAPLSLTEWTVRRSHYVYGQTSDFFTSDLIDEYAKAANSWGFSALNAKDYPLAHRAFQTALRFHPEFATAAFHRAFAFFSQGNWPAAEKEYLSASMLYQKTIELTDQYHSLPEVVQGIKQEWSLMLVHLGVVRERLGRREESLAAYEQAIQLDPRNTQAHFNHASVSWQKEDWPAVVKHMEQVVAMDPGNAKARGYWELAKRKMQGKRQER